MKLIHQDFSFKIELLENKVTNLIIESSDIFEEIVNEFNKQIRGEEGKLILSKACVPLEIKKYAEIILNPFDLNINNKRILTKLYDEIKDNINKSELYIKWNELYPKITEVLDLIIEGYDYNLEYNDNLEIKEFFKILNLRFNIEFSSSLENIIDYMNLHNSILGTKLFILVNINSFYSKEKLKYMYEQSFYRKYNLLIIEPFERKIFEKDEKKYIIDRDGCFIY